MKVTNAYLVIIIILSIGGLYAAAYTIHCCANTWWGALTFFLFGFCGGLIACAASVLLAYRIGEAE